MISRQQQYQYYSLYPYHNSYNNSKLIIIIPSIASTKAQQNEEFWVYPGVHRRHFNANNWLTLDASIILRLLMMKLLIFVINIINWNVTLMIFESQIRIHTLSSCFSTSGHHGRSTLTSFLEKSWTKTNIFGLW